MYAVHDTYLYVDHMMGLCSLHGYTTYVRTYVRNLVCMPSYMYLVYLPITYCTYVRIYP